MRRSFLALMPAVLLSVQVAAAGPSIKTSWSGFQQQVSQSKLKNRAVRISVSTGDALKTTFLRAEDGGLVVVAGRKTRSWATRNGEAMIPRDSVSTVQFSGRVGRRGLLGGLAGLGTGAAAAGATAASMSGGNCEGSACGAVLVAIPVLAVLGYLVGHAMDKPAPSFIIEH
jgi:hypothetical protein